MKLYFQTVKNYLVVYGKPFGERLLIDMVGIEDFLKIKREVSENGVCVFLPHGNFPKID